MAPPFQVEQDEKEGSGKPGQPEREKPEASGVLNR